MGVTDSWEAYYQAVRRYYRFGQKRRSACNIFASEQEGSVVANLKRKEADAKGRWAMRWHPRSLTACVTN